MFCAYSRPRYQVSFYRTIGPLVWLVMICLKFFSFFIKVFFYLFGGPSVWQLFETV